MINTTDYVVLGLLAFYAWQGWRRGFLRSVLTPVIFVVSIVLGVVYFRRTNNLLVGFLVGLLGPIVLNFIVSLLLKLLRKADDEEEAFSSIDRFLGSAVEVAWGLGILIILAIGVSLAPLESLKLGHVKKDILHSFSYRGLYAVVKTTLPQFTLSAQKQSVGGPSKPADTQAVQNSEEYQKLMRDPRIKELLADEETLKQIQEKDLAKLLNNPRIATILQDTQLLKEFLKLNQKMVQTGNIEVSPDSSAPKEPL